MRYGFVQLTFVDDRDGPGPLSVQAEVQGYSGKGSAYFNTDDLKKFAESIAQFPLATDDVHVISSGFAASKDRSEQEHVGIEIYPIDKRGHIGVQVRIATPIWPETRLKSQKAAKLEIITTYEPLAQFSKDFFALVSGIISEATLVGETLC